MLGSMTVQIGADISKLTRKLAQGSTQVAAFARSARQAGSTLSNSFQQAESRVSRLTQRTQYYASELSRTFLNAGRYVQRFGDEVYHTDQDIDSLHGSMQRLSHEVSDTSRTFRNTSSSLSQLRGEITNTERNTRRLGSSMSGLGSLIGRMSRSSSSLGTLPAYLERATEEGQGLMRVLLSLSPALVPIGAVATTSVMGLASSFVAAGAGAAGFAAVAIPNLSSIFDAQEQINKAQKKYDEAVTSEDKAEALKELRAIYGGLNRDQLKAVKSLQEFKSFYSSFAKDFQKPVLQAFTKSLTIVRSLLEKLKPAIQGAAQGILTLLDAFDRSLKTKDLQNFFQFLKQNAGNSLVAWGKAFGNILRGLLNLMVAFSPVVNDMQNGLVRLTQRFVEWSSRLQDSKGFQQFIEYSKQNLPAVKHLFVGLIELFVNFVKVLAPIGAVVLDLINVFIKLTNQFLTTNPVMAQVAIVASQIGTAFLLLAPIIVKVISSVTTLVGWLKPLITGVTQSSSVLTALRTAFSVLTGPIGLVITAITTFISVLVTLYHKNEEFRTKVNRIWQAIREVITQVIQAVSQYVMQVTDRLKTFWDRNQNDFMKITDRAWNMIGKIVNTAMDLIMSIFKFVYPVLEKVVQGAWNSIKGIINGATKAIMGIIDIFSGLLTGNFSKMWKGIMNLFSGAIQFIWNLWTLSFYGRIIKVAGLLVNGLKSTILSGLNYLKTSFSTFISNVWGVVSGGFRNISSIIGNTMSTIRSIVSSILSSIRQVFSTGLSGIANLTRSVFSGIWNAVKSMASGIASSATSAFYSMKSGIQGAISGLGSLISGTFRAIINYLKGINLRSIGRNILNGLVNGFWDKVNYLTRSVTSIANWVKDAFYRLFDIHSPSRWMRDEIGENMILGWMRGIEQMKGRVLTTSQKMGEWMKPDVPHVQLGYDTPAVCKLHTAHTEKKLLQLSADSIAAPQIHVQVRNEADMEVIRTHVETEGARDGLVRTIFEGR
ncbi:hypothetical protein KXS12_16255 [Priestia filamentosa]|uniref:phage tail protein n=1 Tax=Priestia filamentosa TaxID=1402861 RepID=UPI003F16FDCE